jgi:nitrate reductase delta subunit
LSAAALCLTYPDDGQRDQHALLDQVAEALPEWPGGLLRSFLAYRRGSEPERLAVEYVDTFDLRRRCCLYLTYYSHGDTRKRGMALLQFTSAYRQAGIELAPGELPDHLGVVCAVAARRPDVGLPLLRRHRAAIELLRITLAEAASPYLDVVDLIRAALPDPAPEDLGRALQLAADGPPEEDVGLEPFAPPDYMGGRR